MDVVLRSAWPSVCETSVTGAPLLMVPEDTSNRHGLRASELAELRWDQVDFDHGLLHVRRKKSSPAMSCARYGCSGASTMQPAMCL
jgi:hypothetical protein